ncbi:MAG: SulP family inorganic anion transporter [bacterium]|nr:SulP family inorganic anion transporter [bacterium]
MAGSGLQRRPHGAARFAPNLSGTRLATAGYDLGAGLTVAALAVPQGIAYALIAGLPAEMGLLAAALPTVIAAFFGSSSFVITGPTVPTALLIGVSVVEPALAAGQPVPIAAVLQTGMLAALILMALGVFGIGRASRFLSDSVVGGFIAGVGLLIALRHVPAMLGADAHHAVGDSLAPSAWWLISDALRAAMSTDPRALSLALGVPAGVLLLRRIDRRLPAGLIALGVAALTSSLLGWNEGAHPLATLQAVSLGQPEFHVPEWLNVRAHGASALAIALLATVQTIGAARSLERRAGHLDPDRELFAQGSANLIASLIGAMPTSGSLSRSAVNRAAGARSRLAALIAGSVVLLLLPTLGPLLTSLPLAALAGFVVLSGLELIDLDHIRRSAATRGDGLILFATLGTTLWLDLVQAVYAGVFISLVLLVLRAGRLQMMEVVHVGQGRLREIPPDERSGSTPVAVLHLEGDLNFAVAPELSDQLDAIVARGPEILILRLKRARHLDATVLEVLRNTLINLRAHNAQMVLCGLTDPIAQALERTELGRELGPDGVLRTGPRLFEGFERALASARKSLEPRTEAEIFRWDEPARWSYEI